MVRDDDAEVYRKHADDLVALATTLVGPSDASDVVAAAVARTIASSGWDRVEDRYAYWVRAVYNEAKSSYRSSMRRAAREDLVARRASTTSTDVETHPEVLEAMASLSMRQRSVVYLTYWRDLPVGEVAAVLDISDGSVRRHLARARSNLRRKLT